MAKAQKEMTVVERLAEMNARGSEQIMPGTLRHIRLRTLDAATLLRDDKLPDILTPLITKSIYAELSDKDVRQLLEHPKEKAQDALAMLDSIDYICEKAIADGTKVKDLTIGEKRWIFRLVLGPAELLVSFRYEEEPDVEVVAEGEDVQ